MNVLLSARRWLAALVAVLALGLASGWPWPAAAATDVELPPVDQVFVLSAQATARDRIEVRWKIADGFYLYRHRTSVKAGATFADARLALPEGAKHHDQFFGDVQTYRHQLVGVLTGTAADAATGVTLTVKYQGCADVGVCYPPQTRTLSVALPTAAGDAGFGLGRGSGASPFGLGSASAAGMPLPEERAFTTEVITLDGNALLLRLTPAKGYYIYRDKLSVRLDAGAGLGTALPPPSRLPKATPYRDEHFGNVAVYFDQIEIPLAVTRDSARAANGTLVVGLQGCQDNGICYPPMTRRLAVALPAGRLTPAATATAAPPVGGDAAATGQSDVGAVLPPGAGAPADAAAARVPAEKARNLAALAPSVAGDVLTPDGNPASPADVSTSAPPASGLLLALLLALLGGLLLNLMPCVLPVLSLKALSLAQSGASPAHARRHALAYTAGVLLSMLALGGLALALRGAGLALGWGFQLQQPLVLAVLALVMFALGLSLSGLWFVSVRLGARSGALLQGGGIRGDFFAGVLAVVLATPCTVPAMGAALAYAFTGPMLGGVLVFLLLGLGLALPFLAIGFIPALARRLPKPGAWMETFKQLLAFPLYATAAWLVWVLTGLRGADAAGLWLAAAIMLALALWAWSRARGGGRGWQVLAGIALLGLIWPLARLQALERPATIAAAATAARNPAAPVPWSERTLADLRAQGRVVFVDMTADWCVTCKVNEAAVFSGARFRTALEAANAVYMVGDYTDVDPAITAYLQRHRAVGVPLYVVYPRNGGAGRVLPTLLTPGMAEDALREAAL